MLALGLAGCVSDGGKLTPTGDAQVTVNMTAKRTSAGVKLANRVIVTLPPSMPTQIWKIIQADERFLQILSDTKPVTNGGESATAVFLAIRPGITRLRFVLVPVDAVREAVPADFHEITLKIE